VIALRKHAARQAQLKRILCYSWTALLHRRKTHSLRNVLLSKSAGITSRAFVVSSKVRAEAVGVAHRAGQDLSGVVRSVRVYWPRTARGALDKGRACMASTRAAG